MFEIFLLNPGGAALDPERVIQTVLASGPVRRGARSPWQLFYRNDDTSVIFQVCLEPRSASALGDVVEEAEEPEEHLEEETEGEASGEETDSAPVDDVEHAVLTLPIPVIRPTFFALEAIEYAGTLASALKLQLEHASSFEDEGGTAGTAGSQGTPAAILESWLRANRKAALSMNDRAALTCWTAQKSRSFWAYGRARAALAAELEPEGIQVPPIYLVSRDTAKKTLFVWDQGTPSVIPRTDLVLLRRERLRSGLLRSKRIVEEGVVGGDALAEILSLTGEVRSVPADLIVWRGGPDTPKSVEERIAALPLERPESVSRTELSHIIDVDLSTDPAEDMP